MSVEGESLTALSLVQNGYFPRELPPPFSSGKFAALIERDRDALPKKAVKTQCVRHNLAGPSGMRRPLGVPNPRSFLLLAEEFERQWSAIYDHLYDRSFSMSRPEIPEDPDRAVRPRFRIGEHHRLRPRDWRGQRYVLITDVSRFYPSLYTHSIPWALEGKQKAKSNIGNTDSDRLDKALRDTSDGQTMGVPIGPDTSFLAAEIVLSAVDKSLSSKIEMRGHRYIDDYELAFPTRSQAEEALAMLEESLSEYELTINFDKTEILELPQPFHLDWIHDLATFRIRTGRPSQTITDLIALFSRAASISQSRRGPLKYALQRCRSVEIEDLDVWVAFQNLVWSSVSAEPTTIPVALDLLAVKSVSGAFEVDREAAGEVVETLIRTHSPIRNASEVAWGLWAAISLEVELSAESGRAVSGMEDDFVALLSLDAYEQGLFGSHQLDVSLWESITDYDKVMAGPHWLLAYEAAVAKWLEGPTSHVKSDPFFKVLKQRRVRFYDSDPDRNPFTGPAGPLPGGLVPDEYV